MSSVADRAYNHLRAAILSGEYPGGTPLREERLAASLGVSRTPVREALRRLGAEGLVIIDTNRGAQVSSWTEKDIDDIYSVRALLEPYGARLAAGRASQDDLDHLTKLLGMMESAANSRSDQAMMESTRLVLEFHEYILNLSGNSRLAATISGIVAFPVLYRAQRSYSQSRLHEGHAEHRLLVEALREHDGELAEAIMRQHIMAARAEERRLFRLMAEEPPA